MAQAPGVGSPSLLTVQITCPGLFESVGPYTATDPAQMITATQLFTDDGEDPFGGTAKEGMAS